MGRRTKKQRDHDQLVVNAHRTIDSKCATLMVKRTKNREIAEEQTFDRLVRQGVFCVEN